MKSKSSLFILIVVILLIVGALIYFFIGKGDSADTAATTTTGLVSTRTGTSSGLGSTSPTESATGSQVVALLRNLSAIQLDGSLFRNPSFALLQDISISLPLVANQGRRNPFAPVGVDAVITTPTPVVDTNSPSF